jgi:hypothetical protein
MKTFRLRIACIPFLASNQRPPCNRASPDIFLTNKLALLTDQTSFHFLTGPRRLSPALGKEA